MIEILSKLKNLSLHLEDKSMSEFFNENLENCREYIIQVSERKDQISELQDSILKNRIQVDNQEVIGPINTKNDFNLIEKSIEFKLNKESNIKFLY